MVTTADGMETRSKITSLLDNQGKTIYRAHIWTDEGYSTKTFYSTSEAQFWIASKNNPTQEGGKG